MSAPGPISLDDALAGVEYLPNRTAEMHVAGGAERAFAEIAPYREGGIYVGFYSGDSEWERHPVGDEIVMALAGTTTLILWIDGELRRVAMGVNELVVVPRDTWHRFEGSDKLKILAVTPQPTDHSLTAPDA